MTAEPDLLPLPEWTKRDDLGGLVPSEVRAEMRAYTRANLAPLQAEIEALRAEVATWEGLHASEVQVRQRWQSRAERLAEALRKWWAAHRPVGWTEDQHRACPYVNLPTDTDKALAEALLREQEEGRG